MGRPTTKEDLIVASNENYEKLWDLIDSFPEKGAEIEFDFSEDEKKTEAHWNRDVNLKDVLIHLYEWHQLLINWINSNIDGVEMPFLPAPYNWKNYADMNVGFFEKHKDTKLEDAKRLFAESHKEVMDLVEGFSNEDLFSKGAYKWTGGTTLGSYCVSSTSSHYDWAIKKLKAYKRALKTK